MDRLEAFYSRHSNHRGGDNSLRNRLKHSKENITLQNQFKIRNPNTKLKEQKNSYREPLMYTSKQNYLRNNQSDGNYVQNFSSENTLQPMQTLESGRLSSKRRFHHNFAKRGSLEHNG